MGSYLNRPCSFGELSAKAPTTFWSSCFFLFETPGSRPGWSLWSPPILFLGALLLASVRRVLGLQVAALQAWLPSFSHGWPVNSELKLSTAYEVHPALVTAHSSSFASLSIFLQQR